MVRIRRWIRMSSRHRARWTCAPGRVPGGASRDRTGDLLVANQTLSQLSYGPSPERVARAKARETLVGLGGVAPPTSPLSGVRSN